MPKKRKKVAAKKTKAVKKVRAVRCSAKTKDGKRCKKMSSGKSKCCSVHKKKRAA